MKKILIALLALFGWISAALAENFYIENYDVILHIDSYNNINIEENIDVNFTQYSHGIYRKIPVVNNVVRADGKKYKTFAKITNVQTSEQNSILRENEYYIIKLGDPNKLIKGEKSYTIKYKYALDGPDDELYFNIIGTGWDTDIKKATFKIYMPKSFPFENVGLSMGEYGTKGFETGAVFKTDNILNTVEGHITQALKPHEALTIRIPLPKGYFIKRYNPIKPLCFFLITMFSLISLIYWFIFGKDDKVIPTVNFYPPKDFNSALVGLIYSEQADIDQVVSLIIYLADKGYIRIEDDGISQTLYKLKEYDGKNLECKELMNALFEYGRNTISTIELETSKNFYKACEQIVSHLNITKNVIYEKDSIELSTKLPVVLSMIVLYVIFYTTMINFTFSKDRMFLLIVLSLFIITPAISWHKVNSLIFDKIIIFCFPILFLILSFGTSIIYPEIAIYSLTGLIVSGVCLYQLPKKNKQGLAILGHILGYKKFLETAQKHELEKLAADNPQYYFNMLPYAYVLGVSDVWIEKFKNIANCRPNWYSGHFNSDTFNNLTHNFCEISSPSIANGGISSSSSGGGGCSGGGSGGGGGGSW